MGLLGLQLEEATEANAARFFALQSSGVTYHQ
jgi:hypothetical protein